MGFPVQNLIVQKRTAKHRAGPLDAPVALYNPDGTPFAGGSDAPAAPAAGSLTPAMLNGYDASTGHGRIPQVRADGTGFDLIDPATLKGQKGDKGDPGAAGAKGATGATGPAGPAGKSVTAIALTADAAGKITGGTVTFSDKTTAAITVTTATA
ncbi:phosphoenolpyruvate synthase [Bifidobacterium margollesii]|uniref:Phosphoenolpyruvate synthase n=2 Tax=Bifidobacterium margollesii TaxID=2020964 RepID=A0A2N5J7D0_9BIFI|nr:phosphoenolpyruvate synthase [Bifidobacterium margollesii]